MITIKSAEPFGSNREDDYETWKENRKNFVGSSDIATVMGVSRWKSPLELWAERTGKTDKEFTDNRAARYGRKVEPKILELFSEDHPEYELYPNNLTFQSKQHAFALATPDSFIIDKAENEMGIVEVKHASFGLEMWGPECAPADAHIQVIWQMGILEIPFSFVTAIVGGQAADAIEPKFVFDDEANHIYEQCLEKSRAFIECVQRDIPPGARLGDLAIINKIIKAAPSPEVRELPDEMIPVFDRYRKYKKEQSELESAARRLKKRTDDLKAQLVLACGGPSIGQLSDGREILFKHTERAGYTVDPTSYWEVKFDKE